MNAIMGIIVFPGLAFLGIIFGLANFYADEVSYTLVLISVALIVVGSVGFIKCCTGDWDFERNTFR